MLREIGGKDRKALEAAGFAIHVVYERVGDIAKTKKQIVDRYMNGFSHMLSTKQQLPFGGAAPQNVVIDLRTMRVIGRDIEHADAIAACRELD